MCLSFNRVYYEVHENILMKTHNDSCTPVLLLHETKPNVVHFSCRKAAYKAEMNIEFLHLGFYIWILHLYLYVVLPVSSVQ